MRGVAAPRKVWLAAIVVAAFAGVLGGTWLWRLPPALASAPAPTLQTPAEPARLTPPVAAPPSVSLASVAEMLEAKKATDWRLRRLRSNTSILVIEFPGLTDQGNAFNRVAAMYEKRAGRRDRVLTDTQMAQLLLSSGDNVASFYQGHDYTADMLARFFSQATAQHIPLNAQELRLRALLVDAGVLKPNGDAAFSARGLQAVVSFTGTQPDDPGTRPDESVDAVRRESVLLHELSHGEFFTNGAYRVQCWDFWRKSLSKHEREVFKRYLGRLEYDTYDEELMANETQAVLMHTPDQRAFNARSLGLKDDELAGLRVRFRLAARSAQSLSEAGR